MAFVLVISGSPAAISRTARLGDYAAEALAYLGNRTRHIQVRDLPAAALLAGDAADPAIAEAAELLAEAEGVVFVTPTYKAAYSGLLKTFLDLLPQYALAGKAILPLATGGSLAHVLMLDYAFRPVLQALGARHSVGGHFMIESALDVTAPELVVDDRQRDMLHRAIVHFDQAVHFKRIDAAA